MNGRQCMVLLRVAWRWRRHWDDGLEHLKMPELLSYGEAGTRDRS